MRKQISLEDSLANIEIFSFTLLFPWINLILLCYLLGKLLLGIFQKYFKEIIIGDISKMF